MEVYIERRRRKERMGRRWRYIIERRKERMGRRWRYI